MALSLQLEMEFSSPTSSPAPLQITVLGSGSSGNAILVRNGQTAFLIDAGLSAKKLCVALEAQNVLPDELAGIALTHEHGDHAGGLRTFCKRFAVPLYATRMTAEAVCFSWKIEQAKWRYFSSGQNFLIADIPLGAFSVPHDAADPVGFLVGPPETRAAILTDLGMVTKNVTEAIRGVRVLYLEANYDDELLESNTKRPWGVKQRISARHGHLSNRSAAELVREVAGPSLHTVVLGHLSEDCNHPDLATRAVQDALDAAGYPATRVVCANRKAPLESIMV